MPRHLEEQIDQLRHEIQFLARLLGAQEAMLYNLPEHDPLSASHALVPARLGQSTIVGHSHGVLSDAPEDR